jgi:hypothetical protein
MTDSLRGALCFFYQCLAKLVRTVLKTGCQFSLSPLKCDPQAIIVRYRHVSFFCVCGTQHKSSQAYLERVIFFRIGLLESSDVASVKI